MISFLIPVFNTKTYLPECLDSILCQAGAEFEVVLLDDGSTDGSGELCNQYAAKYPDIVRVVHKNNEGLLLTRRRGFREAKGNWFICVDSDDYIASDLLQTVAQMIQEYDCDMVMYNFDYVDDDGNHTASRLSISDRTVYERETKREIYEKRLLSVDVNSLCMRAVRRDLLDLDADYSGCGIRNMCEDAIQILPLYTNAKKIVYTSKPLYHYRKGQNSITAKRSFESWVSSKKCHEMTEPYLDIWNVDNQVKSKFYTHACESVVNFARWLIAEKNDAQTKSLLTALRNDEHFQKCYDEMKKDCFSTNYLKFCVPKCMNWIQKGKIFPLKIYLGFERFLKR